jgi:hypothetical protein
MSGLRKHPRRAAANGKIENPDDACGRAVENQLNDSLPFPNPPSNFARIRRP